MADGTHSGAETDTRMRTLLTTFRQVGLPLVQALNAPGEGEAGHLDVEKFGSLVDSTVMLSRVLSNELGASEDSCDAWVRWALAGAASQVVATSFQATGHAVSDDEAKSLAALVTDLQGRFKAQIPAGTESIPNTVATFRAKMTEAMVPVIGAVARYAFGRAEHALLAEVAGEIDQDIRPDYAVACTRRKQCRRMAVAVLECAAFGWSDLCRCALC